MLNSEAKVMKIVHFGLCVLIKFTMKISKTVNVLLLCLNNSFLTKKRTQKSTHTKLSEHYLMQEVGNVMIITLLLS
jgi:hypothetical protein